MTAHVRIVGRIALRYIVSLWVASVIIFMIMRLIPGDPAEVSLGETATPQAIESMKHTLGTDRPLITQYFSVDYGDVAWALRGLLLQRNGHRANTDGPGRGQPHSGSDQHGS